MDSAETAFQADLLGRLRCAEGHLHGVAAMLQRQAECEAVLGQLLAVQGALRQISIRLIEQQVTDCLRVSLPAAEVKQRERALARLVNLYTVVGAHPQLAGRASPSDEAP